MKRSMLIHHRSTVIIPLACMLMAPSFAVLVALAGRAVDAMRSAPSADLALCPFCQHRGPQ